MEAPNFSIGSWAWKGRFFQGLVLGVWNFSYLEEVSEPELATQNPNWIRSLPNLRSAFWGPLFNPVRVLLRKCPKLNNQVIAALKLLNRFSSLRASLHRTFDKLSSASLSKKYCFLSLCPRYSLSISLYLCVSVSLCSHSPFFHFSLYPFFCDFLYVDFFVSLSVFSLSLSLALSRSNATILSRCIDHSNSNLAWALSSQTPNAGFWCAWGSMPMRCEIYLELMSMFFACRLHPAETDHYRSADWASVRSLRVHVRQCDMQTGVSWTRFYLESAISENSKVLVVFRVWSFNLRAPYILSADDLGNFSGILWETLHLEADDFLRACCRMLWPPKSYGL